MLNGTATLAVQYVPEEEDYGTPFYVESYGAVGNGSTDDAPAIQRAYDAAWNFNKVGAANAGAPACVVFGNKTYAIATPVLLKIIRTNDWYPYTQNGVADTPSPTYINNGVIAFYGPDATIKYSSSVTTRYAFLQGITWDGTNQAGGQYKTYGNTIVDGFTIDPNFRVPQADCANVFWGQGTTNYTNMKFKNITVLGNMNTRTAMNTKRCLTGIAMHGWPTARAQTHAGYMKDIIVDNCVLPAQGKGVSILTPTYYWTIGGVTYNCGSYHATNNPNGSLDWNPYTFDNIAVSNTTTDCRHHIATGVHLGSYGSGISCTVTNCDCTDSTDNLIEVDAFNECTVEGCTLSNSASAAGFTWFSYPYYNHTVLPARTPVYITHDCHYIGGANPYWPNVDYPTEPAKRAAFCFGMVTLGSAAIQLRGRTWGDFYITDCTAIIQNSTTEAYSTDPYWPDPITGNGTYMWQQTIGLNGPMRKLYIDNVQITDTGPHGASSTSDYIKINQRSPNSSADECYIHNVKYRKTDSGAFSLLPAAKCNIAGYTGIDTDITGLP